MEETMGEIGDSFKEANDKASVDVAGGVKVNGDLNGALEEAMETEAADTPVSKISTVDASDTADAKDAACEDGEEGPESTVSIKDEAMEVDSEKSNTKSETHNDSDDKVDLQSSGSVKNGPSASAQKGDVEENSSVKSESISEQNDHNSEVKNKLENNKDESSDEAVSKEPSSVSESGRDDKGDNLRTVQNGDTAVDGSDAEEAADLSKESKPGDDMTTPEKGETSTEESPDGEGDGESTPKKSKKGKSQSPASLSLTPRRSSRNLNKQKSYNEDKEEAQEPNDGSDIEEIALEDPLAGTGDQQRENKENSKTKNSRPSTNKTIVVNDTKHLVEIASGSKQPKGQKKEPTLVIIDTNSILSGRGSLAVTPVPAGTVPVTQTKLPQRPGLQITPAHMPSSSSSTSSVQQSFSVHPVGSHSQAMFSGAVTAQRLSSSPAPSPQPAKPPVILPSLTDDMYVVEAPSFIVPYVYEKPPIKPLKDFIGNLEDAIKKEKENDEKKKKDEAEQKKDDGKTKEDGDKDKEGEEEEAGQNKAKGEQKKGDEDKEKEKDEEEAEEKTEAAKSNKDGSNDQDAKQSKDDTATEEQDKDKDKEKSKDKKEDKDAPDTDSKTEGKPDEAKKPPTYFDNPLGKFFMQIGINLVQEHVQTDLLRSQKKKRDREGGKGVASTQMAINSLQQTLEFSKENNEPFHLKQKKCDFCSFKTESALVMAHHMETPHMKNYIYRCNFCSLEVRSPHDILFHMEAEHNVRGRLERGPAFHQCPNCPFEDNQKGKLTRHLVSCTKKYRPEKNQEPPLDWEPPAKIPRVSRSRPFPMGAQGVPGLQAAQKGGMSQQHPLLPKLPVGSSIVGQPGMGQVNSVGRGRGRPPMQGQSRYMPDLKSTQIMHQQRFQSPMSGMLYRSSPSGSSPQVLVPTAYQIAGNQLYQNSKGQGGKLQQQPSISITPLPRQPSGTPPHAHGAGASPSSAKPGNPSGGKATFVICEICDGYIKDLEQLRNHMQWIHKVKIHPKMIYNRPPLNCQKCQFRFFTDQGLERHLLGSHGLVTSSMQEAANKGKDGGRCPVCGRVYQWKLLNHVARDHSMTLKPAHLSYKCTVCTATFGMYKQFENHVYSAHSVVAKRVMDKKPGASSSPTVTRPPGQSQQGDSLLKPLKINDEITIIPQPARSSRPGPSPRSTPLPAHLQGGKAGDDRPRRGREDDGVQIIDLDDSPSKDTLSAVQERLRRRTSLEVSQVDTEDDASPAMKKTRRD